MQGFGHSLYSEGDPRAAALLDAVSTLSTGPEAKIIKEITETMTRHSGAQPNIDFALAALSLNTGMSPDAGETIFVVARMAGWLAHALEEYGDRPSRFRPSGLYGGRSPSAH